MRNPPSPTSPGSTLSRRSILSAAVGTAAGASLAPGALLVPASAGVVLRPRSRVLRVAHLTDAHVQPEKAAGDGLAACLKHLHTHDPKPDLIITGGDNVMDVFATDADRAKVQLDVWKRVLADHTDIPFEHTIGNHDVWGWNKGSSKTIGTEDLWGKKWALDAFGLAQRFRTFDRAGWRFIILDSTFPSGGGYTARLDDEQFEFLAATLAETRSPVCVVSHIPIISACAYFDGNNEKSGDWVVPGSWMHTDARRIKDLFFKHGTVKLALSGHIHLVDRVDYLGTTYLCNGAVSGAWWGGAYHECNPGYGLIDLYDDGSFESKYIEYGWTPRE